MYQSDLEEILELCGIPPNTNGFWRKHPKRFCQEIEKMANSTNAKPSYEDGSLIFVEDIINNYGTPFTFLITISDNYPFKAPKVFLLEPEITCEEGIHQYSDDSLCLFYPDKYSTSWSILDIRNQACSWCSLIEDYQKTGIWGGAEASH